MAQEVPTSTAITKQEGDNQGTVLRTVPTKADLMLSRRTPSSLNETLIMILAATIPDDESSTQRRGSDQTSQLAKWAARGDQTDNTYPW